MKSYYSNEELQEFKILITNKIKKAEEEYELLRKSISRDNNGTDDTCRSFNLMEEGQATLSHEENNILAQKQYKFLEALKGALIRIENKSYGICFKTGQLIPKERLIAVPHTTVTIENKKSVITNIDISKNYDQETTEQDLI